MLKELLQKFQDIADKESDPSKVAPIAMQLIGVLMEDNPITDEEWASVTDQSFRHAALMFVPLVTTNPKLHELLKL